MYYKEHELRISHADIRAGRQVDFSGKMIAATFVEDGAPALVRGGRASRVTIDANWARMKTASRSTRSPHWNRKRS